MTNITRQNTSKSTEYVPITVQLNLFNPPERGEHKGRELDTSVKFGTKYSISSYEILKGEGLDINDSKLLTKKAQKKYITLCTIFKLINIAEQEGNTKILHSLWNTYHCLNKLKYIDGKLHGEYCKNKFCTVCNGIRKAKLITKYLPVLDTWEDPYFVTLTITSSDKDKLEDLINQMLKAFRTIQNKYKTRSVRNQGPLLKGLRTLESNFNAKKRTYNPHFHIIVPNKEIAYILKNEWEQYWGKKRVNPAVQDVKKVFNKENMLVEVIKYATTLFTEKNKKNKNGDYTIYLKALYNIICALRDKHLIEPFGFKLPKPIKNKPKMKFVTNPTKYLYNSKQKDWFNEETGEALTGYNPSKSLEYILNNKMDTKLE